MPSSRVSVANGLRMQPAKPCERYSRSSSIRAVRAITGMALACGILDRRSSSSTAKPSISGIWISIRSTSYLFSLSLETSSLLSPQQSHWARWRRSISLTMPSCRRSSSSTRTRVPSIRRCRETLSVSKGDFPSAGGRGSRTMNSLPCPFRLSTRMEPPIRETSLEQMARPRPKPDTPRAFSSRSKAVNILSASFSSMPLPVSRTHRRSSPLLYSASSRTLPSLVNFKAFESRLLTICWRWPLSPQTTTSVPEKPKERRRLFLCASGA